MKFYPTSRTAAGEPGCPDRAGAEASGIDKNFTKSIKSGLHRFQVFGRKKTKIREEYPTTQLLPTGKRRLSLSPRGIVSLIAKVVFLTIWVLIVCFFSKFGF